MPKSTFDIAFRATELHEDAVAREQMMGELKSELEKLRRGLSDTEAQLAVSKATVEATEKEMSALRSEIKAQSESASKVGQSQ